MRSAVPYLLLAAFLLPGVPVSSAQTVDPQSGAVCEPQPADMNTIRSKAETGDASAEYELGRSMLSRKPTDSESASAIPWFRRSAELGYAPAEYMYGNFFFEGRWKDTKQLVYWWTKAAEQGNVHAQLWLGVLYEVGRDGLNRDYVQALKWLSMAAKQGQPDAQATLGQMYENGEGVSQDYGVAAYWYRKAADHTMDLGGAGAAASNLVLLYEDGHATSQDYVFFYLAYAYRQDTDGMQEIAHKMNPSQIADAQSRVKAWVKSRVACPTTAAASWPMSGPTSSAR